MNCFWPFRGPRIQSSKIREFREVEISRFQIRRAQGRGGAHGLLLKKGGHSCIALPTQVLITSHHPWAKRRRLRESYHKFIADILIICGFGVCFVVCAHCLSHLSFFDYINVL